MVVGGTGERASGFDGIKHEVDDGNKVRGDGGSRTSWIKQSPNH